MNWEQYEPYATPVQLRYLKAVSKHGSQRNAAKALGVHAGTVATAVAAVKHKAARKGFSPEEDEKGLAPEGFFVDKTSVYTKTATGAKWTKTSAEKLHLSKVARIIVDQLTVPKAKPVKLVKACRLENQLTVLPIGDAHIGLLAWGEEVGEDHDLKIAERELVAVAQKLTLLAPATKRALIVNVGDYFHVDSYRGVTERGGNLLDCDSRYPKMVRIGIACMVAIIDAALKKHEEVEVINVAGNHDKQTSFLLSLVLERHYRNEPRVLVRAEPTPFFYVEFGKCLIGATHGDTCKPTDLPEIMAVDRHEAWGRTNYRYWYTGHIHHDSKKELRGCVFESFRTLARPDAWHHGSGYRSGRDMKCIVLDKDHGEVMRHTVGISRVKNEQ